MEDNQDQITAQDTFMLILLGLGSVYSLYEFYTIKPWVLGLICVGFVILYFLVGNLFERAFNKINMWRKGVELDPCLNASFPFKVFDLKWYLDKFYRDPKNRDNTFLGLSAERSQKDDVVIPDKQRSQHMQILGMIGTGKTESVFVPLIYQDALKQRPVIIIDAKGEFSVINRINSLLASIGREGDFLLFSLSHKDSSCSYNPLYVGECDPQIIIDAFFNNFEDDNSFFRETSKTIFTHTFHILHSLGKPFTVMDVYTYLTNDHCRRSINAKIKPNNQKGSLNLQLLEFILDKLTEQYKGWQHVITGFNNYLMAHSDPLLNEADSDIILTEAIRQRKIMYFQLPTNAYPIQAKSIGRIVQANLRYISSLIQTGQIPKDILVSVMIDEYASFAEESFVEVLNKARSSGMMITIAHQSLSDLIAISETFMKQIDENTLNKIYLRQTDPMLSDLIAKSMGTFVKQEKTYRMEGGKFGNQIYSGESSNKTVHEFHFHPDKVKSLHKYGQGYFVSRGDNTHQCVNFGRFEESNTVEYKKKSKTNSKEGLGLFERYFTAQSPVDLESSFEPTIKKRELIFEE